MKITAKFIRDYLENCPAPICTKSVNDETIEKMIYDVTESTKEICSVKELDMNIEKVDMTFFSELESFAINEYKMPYYEDAYNLISEEGLKLGNYHYDIDRFVNAENKVEVYLTRFFEECAGCPLFDKECTGENPPPNFKDYPCANMKPVLPYADNYDFYSIEEVEETIELTEVDKLAIRLIFENEKI
jgi:hypothetical protein